MDIKLTLKLNQAVIMKAKQYAKEHKTSLSRLIENQLLSLTEENKNRKMPTISPLVNSLSGIIELQQDFDFKKSYTDHLSKKYQ